MKEPGLDDRHRDADGQISGKHRNTLIDTLRDTYGQNFAPGYSGRDTLGDLLDRSGAPSLSQYLKDK